MGGGGGEGGAEVTKGGGGFRAGNIVFEVVLGVEQGEADTPESLKDLIRTREDRRGGFDVEG